MLRPDFPITPLSAPRQTNRGKSRVRRIERSGRSEGEVVCTLRGGVYAIAGKLPVGRSRPVGSDIPRAVRRPYSLPQEAVLTASRVNSGAMFFRHFSRGLLVGVAPVACGNPSGRRCGPL